MHCCLWLHLMTLMSFQSPVRWGTILGIKSLSEKVFRENLQKVGFSKNLLPAYSDSEGLLLLAVGCTKPVAVCLGTEAPRQTGSPAMELPWDQQPQGLGFPTQSQKFWNSGLLGSAAVGQLNCLDCAHVQHFSSLDWIHPEHYPIHHCWKGSLFFWTTIDSNGF